MAQVLYQTPIAPRSEGKGESYIEKSLVEEERSVNATSELVQIDASLDKAITRKFDTHIVPWLFGLWLLAFVDRSNVGNAKIDGLVTDLALVGDKFNVVSRELMPISQCRSND